MKRLLYALAAIIILIAGYFLYMYWALGNDSAPGQVPNEIIGENPEGEADPSRMTLTMTTWRWQSALYNDGRVIRPNKAGAFTLTFMADGTFSATTDCNGSAGKYIATKDGLAFTEMASTLMFCEGSQETQFFQMLANTSGYHFTSKGELILDLKFDSGSVVFR